MMNCSLKQVIPFAAIILMVGAAGCQNTAEGVAADTNKNTEAVAEGTQKAAEKVDEAGVKVAEGAKKAGSEIKEGGERFDRWPVGFPARVGKIPLDTREQNREVDSSTSRF